MPRRKTRPGRKTGGSRRGFFYRAGRGWHAFHAGRAVPLTDEAGNKLRQEKLPDDVLRDAYARWRLANRQPEESLTAPSTITVMQVIDAYLSHAKANGADKT